MNAYGISQVGRLSDARSPVQKPAPRAANAAHRKRAPNGAAPPYVSTALFLMVREGRRGNHVPRSFF